jgi:hypothetical protein
MKKILILAVVLIASSMAFLVEDSQPILARNVQQALPSGATLLYLPFIRMEPAPTPTLTSTPTVVATPTAINTPVPTPTPVPPTPLPPPPPQPVYFNITVTRCEPNAGVTYVNGTTYVGGVPRSGYIVVFSWAPDGPIVARIQSGPHGGYAGWSPGFYSHILSATGPRAGNWYFWIINQNEQRTSEIAHLQTHGEAGPGKCQQGVVDFDAR